MTLLESEPNIEKTGLPDYIDPEVLAGLGSTTLQLGDITRPLAVVPKDRIDELCDTGAHGVWNALSARLAPGIALQVVFDDDQNLNLVPIVAQKWNRTSA